MVTTGVTFLTACWRPLQHRHRCGPESSAHARKIGLGTDTDPHKHKRKHAETRTAHSTQCTMSRPQLKILLPQAFYPSPPLRSPPHPITSTACLAPQSALDKLPVAATPRASLGTPSDFLAAVLSSWSAVVEDITRGSPGIGAAAGAGTSRPALFAYALAPQHGPVVRTSLSRLAAEYQKWTQEQVAALARSSVVVMYASAYGNTSALAQAISRGLTKAGVGVSTLNLELASLDEVVSAVRDADGFTIGSPTLGGHMPTPVQVRHMRKLLVCAFAPCVNSVECVFRCI